MSICQSSLYLLLGIRSAGRGPLTSATILKVLAGERAACGWDTMKLRAILLVLSCDAICPRHGET